MLKILLTFGLFLILPCFFWLLLQRGISRKWYAFSTAALLGLTHFILSILYVGKDTVLIGSIMFLFALLGGYPTQYFLYPIQSKRFNPRHQQK